MALVSSSEVKIGSSATNFELLNTVNGQQASLSHLKGENGTAIFFICNHCPFVIHVKDELAQIALDYSDRGISFIAISSNNIETHPQDGPEFMKAFGEQLGFPYLFDETQAVAKAYHAVCTPDLYLFDAELKLSYHGQLDDSRPGNDLPVNGSDFRNSLNCLQDVKENSAIQKPSIGCSIKWK